MIQTICRDCVFKIGDPQTGCELGRLNKFIDQGKANLTDNYYTIERFCNTCRNSPTTIEEVNKQTEIKFCVIIDCNNTNIEDLNKTLNSIKKQTLVPAIIYCVFQNSKTIQGVFKPNYDDFNLLNSSFNMKTYYESATTEEIINELIERTENKCTYLSFIQSFQVFPTDMFGNINKALNEDMKVAHIFKSSESGLKVFSYSSLVAYGYDIMNEEKIEGLEEYTCLI